MSVEALIVVHGGAGRIDGDLHEAAVEGVRRAAGRGLAAMLDVGEPARLDACVDAAIAAVRELEDDPAFNAGRGACMTEAGELEVDAGIMRSRDRQIGAVASVRDLQNPCELARAVMEHSHHVLLVGEGARSFAIQRGVGRFGRELVYTQRAHDRWRRALVARAQGTPGPTGDSRSDTVGAVVRDRRGDLCALGSTGGVLLKLPGRVGDTPIVGAGFYADSRLGAAVATGLGEAILGHVLCYELLRRAAEGAPLQATAEQLCQQILAEERAEVGVVAIGPTGEVAVAHSSEHMSWAIAREHAAVEAGIVASARSMI